MNQVQLDTVRDGSGFIAALDQPRSGGSDSLGHPQTQVSPQIPVMVVIADQPAITICLIDEPWLGRCCQPGVRPTHLTRTHIDRSA